MLSPAVANAAGSSVAAPKAGATKAAVHGLTKDQAIAQARKSGESVQVTSATTTTSTLTANPNGTLTLAQSVAPVRKLVGGTWENLDASLVKSAHGYSPQLSADALTFSAGGPGPLVTMAEGSSSLSLTLPSAFTLTAPTVSGPSATYHSVLPGVDLEVTANAQGGFGETLIVNNATAARNPALASIAFTLESKNLTVRADATGNLSAVRGDGAVLYTAPAPTMWDSTRSSGTAASDQSLDGHSGDPATSTAHIPGQHAHTATLGAKISGRTLTLTPDPSLLTGSSAQYPVYIDPTYNPSTAVSSGGAYAYTSSFTGTCNGSSDLADVAYYDDSSDYLRTGYSDSDCDVANYHTFLQIPISGIAGAVISTTSPPTLSIFNSYSGSCTAQTTDLYQTGAISSKTTWNHEPTWYSTLLASKSYAYGYTTCTPGGNSVGFSGANLTSLVQSSATAGASNITLGLKAATSGVSYSIRHYTDSATLTVTYDYTPSVAAMTGDPSNACESTAALAQAHPIGLGDVVLEAKIAQKNGTSDTAEFYVYNSSNALLNPTVTTSGSNTTSSNPTNVSVPANQYAPLRIKEAFFTAALGLTTAATFHWTVTASDGTLSKASTTTCYFTFDPTAPGNPSATAVSQTGSYCPGIDDANVAQSDCTIGTGAQFTLSDSNANDSTVGSYLYQLNGATPISVSVPSGTASPFNATITLKPTRGTNILTVTAVAANSNIGGNATVIFTANEPTTTSVDKDLSGDLVPDLLTAGTGTGIAPGLWEANGETSGVVQNATDIGYQGDATACNASAFNGDEAVAGDFYGTGMQGALVYNTANTTGAIFSGTGDGSAIQTSNTCGTNNGNDANIETDIPQGSLYDHFYDLVINGQDSSLRDYPLQLVNAYQTCTDSSSGTAQVCGTAGYDNLLATNYDKTSGAYFLTYFENSGSPSPGGTLTISMNTPDGTQDWNNWTLATAYIGTQVDMYLWNQSTGALYLWTGVSVSTSDGLDGTLTYTTSYTLDDANGHTWNKGAALHTLEAADINGDGAPDLWTVDASGNVTADIVTLSTTANASTMAKTTSTLNTADHYWALNDYTTTAQDNTSGTALPLSTSGTAVSSNTGDMFNPDVDFEGSSDLYTTTNAVSLGGSFTVSLWTKPEAYGQMALSQDGVNYPGLMIYPTQSGWEFYLATDDGSGSWLGDSVTGGSAQLGAWAQIQAVYNATSKVMSLYVDNTLVANGKHTAPSSPAVGLLRLGSNIDNKVQTSFYHGQIAQVQVWNGDALEVAQPTTPAAYHQAIVPTRILDTRQNNTPLVSDGTVSVPIVGDTVTPLNGGPAKIPATATAVAVDATVTGETSNGNLIAYADGSQVPVTSSTNFAASTNTTGYQIVPIGPDGKIAFYNYSTGTTHLIVDVTGYFVADPAHTQAGDQTYHPLADPDRLFDTRSNTTYTSLGGTDSTVAGGSSITATITGDGKVPSNATAVAINLTTVGQSGPGLLEAYPTGGSAGTDTALTYGSTAVASLAADVSLGSGTNAGKITIANVGSDSTNIIGDIEGYYTNDTSGQVYHTVNPTRLVDTRIGIEATTSSTYAAAGAIAAQGTYPLTDVGQGDAGQITSLAIPTYALQLTVTQPTSNGNINGYPDLTTKPAASAINWVAGQTIANLALIQPGTDGTIDLFNSSAGTIQLVVDCSGFFDKS